MKIIIQSPVHCFILSFKKLKLQNIMCFIYLFLIVFDSKEQYKFHFPALKSCSTEFQHKNFTLWLFLIQMFEAISLLAGCFSSIYPPLRLNFCILAVFLKFKHLKELVRRKSVDNIRKNHPGEENHPHVIKYFPQKHPWSFFLRNAAVLQFPYSAFQSSTIK